MPDIDIDFADRNQILSKIKYISASRMDNNSLLKHNTGVYLHSTEYDCKKNYCAIPYNEVPENYFKIDLLNFSLYEGIKSNEHLDILMNQEPLWDLLQQEEFVDMLYHVNGHIKVLREMKPTSIEQLAAVLAMIRPAKRHLIGKTWDEVFQEVWIKPTNDEYYFKKSHATAYAVAIVVHMNLICEKISYGYS